MAEPGDPPHDDHDDLIGFASPASLAGRARAPEPELEPEPLVDAEPEDDLFTPVRHDPAPEPVKPELVEPTVVEAPIEPGPRPAREPKSAPVEAGSVFAPSREFSTRRRGREEDVVLPGGGMGLYAVYALILFAVPTFGVSAMIGLLAVTGRAGPDDAQSSSHFVYQQRTLWAAAVAAVAGVILVAAPFALGVPILFALAIWTVLRGASGVWALKSGRAIADPRGWWL